MSDMNKIQRLVNDNSEVIKTFEFVDQYRDFAYKNGIDRDFWDWDRVHRTLSQEEYRKVDYGMLTWANGRYSGWTGWKIVLAYARLGGFAAKEIYWSGLTVESAADSVFSHAKVFSPDGVSAEYSADTLIGLFGSYRLMDGTNNDVASRANELLRQWRKSQS